jgi:magnesium transporter
MVWVSFNALMQAPMQQHLLTDLDCTISAPPVATQAPQWLDCSTQDAAFADIFVAHIASLSGIKLQALHAQDAANPLHPSHYDGVADYDMVVFRGLIPSLVHAHEQQRQQAAQKSSKLNNKTFKAKMNHRLQAIVTQPTTFFISNHCLVTVQHSDKAPLAACLERITGRVTPHQLMLRFINAQVDAYLELRQPLDRATRPLATRAARPAPRV